MVGPTSNPNPLLLQCKEACKPLPQLPLGPDISLLLCFLHFLPCDHHRQHYQQSSALFVIYFIKGKKVPNRHFPPILFPSLASLTPPPPHSLYPEPKSIPPRTNNTQIREEYLTDLSLFPSRSHLIKSSITIVHHLTKYWPNWPKYEDSIHYTTHYCTLSD